MKVVFQVIILICMSLIMRMIISKIGLGCELIFAVCVSLLAYEDYKQWRMRKNG